MIYKKNMGLVYILDRKNFLDNGEKHKNLILKEILTENEADDFMEIQSIITKEIQEEITHLTRKSLISDKTAGFKAFMFCIAMDENKCIGYGYGYIEDGVKDIFYIDTIGVHPDHRKKGIGAQIKIELIRYAFQIPNIAYVKAITQENNLTTIKINNQLGFEPKVLK
jgi:RimJ/RimL family protein N-acetyltransferase